jgi:hypothetical protein
MSKPRLTTERDLRTLSTEELLALINGDIQTMDSAYRHRHRNAPSYTPPQPKTTTSGRSRKKKDLTEILAELAPEPEPSPFHLVTCCDNTLGQFPAPARVRCPFCETWHRAGDFREA